MALIHKKVQGSPSRDLLIVESPGKIKTLRKILGPGWMIEASVGHTTELAHDGDKRLGFDILERQIVTRYLPRGTRGKQVLAKLRAAAKAAGRVYLATDPDREGEAIAWHLVQQLRLKNHCRVSYTQITEAAVKKALQNPHALDIHLVEAQRARQCLDKLVGYEVSPLLWNTTGGKSAGRVQSATLHLICERERERLAFKPENYWVLTSTYRDGFEAVYEIECPVGSAERRDAKSLVAPVVPLDAAAEKERDPSHVPSEAEARLIAEVARTSPHFVEQVEKKEEIRNPPPPLITSSLQQAAGARFRFSPKQTMQLAQELYEGIQGKGLITYMRTDAVALSPEFVTEARAWLKENAPEALAEKAPFFRMKADAQAAHEAIRPTQAALTPELAKRSLSLTRDQLNLYTLIWERAMASQCKPARLAKTKVSVRCAETLWIGRGSEILDPGYLKFWKNTENDKILPFLKVGQKLGFQEVSIDARTTQPPSRYSEPKLVQLMERKGIGRPSTYASTIATLKERDYVILDKSLLAPTSLGLATDEALTRAIPDLVDTEFTARMETELDRIADGKLLWEEFLCGWNRSYLVPALIHARKTLGSGDVSRRASPTAGKRSKTRRPAERGAKPRGTGQPNSQTRSRKAKSIRAQPRVVDPGQLEEAHARAKEQGVLPQCVQGHGELELRLSQKGTLYWKCAQPGCDSIAWHQTFSAEKCPLCQQAMEKIPSTKVTGGYFLKCSRSDSHPEPVTLFRDRQNEKWERATFKK